MDIQTDYTSKFIFRMIHYSNLEFILKHGLYTKNSRMKDPEYVNIGDIQLIEQRQNFHVRINPPGGDLGDYIPFYFGGHSPMLLNIKTGYRGIKKYHKTNRSISFVVLRILLRNVLYGALPMDMQRINLLNFIMTSRI